MDSTIKIMEKPDWVSWDDIHEVLEKAHGINRSLGIVMRMPTLPGDEIAKEVGEDGKMYVALDKNKVVATAAIVPVKKNYWCDKKDDRYACVHFDAVLPEYNGKGIFKALDIRREKAALSMGISKILGDTHERNQHRLKIAKIAGYKYVDYKFCRDHFNIVWVKWLKGCPYSDLRCWLEFHKRKLIVKAKTIIKSIIRKKKKKQITVVI